MHIKKNNKLRSLSESYIALLEDEAGTPLAANPVVDAGIKFQNTANNMGSALNTLGGILKQDRDFRVQKGIDPATGKTLFDGSGVAIGEIDPETNTIVSQDSASTGYMKATNDEIASFKEYNNLFNSVKRIWEDFNFRETAIFKYISNTYVIGGVISVAAVIALVYAYKRWKAGKEPTPAEVKSKVDAVDTSVISEAYCPKFILEDDDFSYAVNPALDRAFKDQAAGRDRATDVSGLSPDDVKRGIEADRAMEMQYRKMAMEKGIDFNGKNKVRTIDPKNDGVVKEVNNEANKAIKDKNFMNSPYVQTLLSKLGVAKNVIVAHPGASALVGALGIFGVYQLVKAYRAYRARKKGLAARIANEACYTLDNIIDLATVKNISEVQTAANMKRITVLIENSIY